MSERKNVLVATADEQVKKVICDSLQDFSKECYVKPVEGGGKAILAILNEGIDLAIVDLNLGGISGLETIEIMRRSRPKVPIVVISSDKSVETGSKVMQQGVFYYMFKPFRIDELKTVVESALWKRSSLGGEI